MAKSMAVRIKALREALKLSQEKFATESDISTSAISKIEVGVIEPSPDQLEKISQRWNCSIDWLESGRGSMSFTKTIAKATDIYQDALYKELKEVNEELKKDKHDWKQKYEELFGMFSSVMKGNLGKLKSLVPAGFFAKKEENRTGVRM